MMIGKMIQIYREYSIFSAIEMNKCAIKQNCELSRTTANLIRTATIFQSKRCREN